MEADNVRRLLVEGNAFRDAPIAINFHPSLTGPPEARTRRASVGVLGAVVRNNRSRRGGALRRGDVRPCEIREESNDGFAGSLEALAADLVARARSMARGSFCDFATEAAVGSR